MDLGEPRSGNFCNWAGADLEGESIQPADQEQDEFHAEKAAVHEAGLKSSFLAAYR